MKIRLKGISAGPQGVRDADSIIEVEGAEARRLIASGQATKTARKTPAVVIHGCDGMGWTSNAWKPAALESGNIVNRLNAGTRHGPRSKQSERAMQQVLLAVQDYQAFKAAETRQRMRRRTVRAQLRALSECSDDDIRRLVRELGPETRELVELKYCELATDAELLQAGGSLFLCGAPAALVRSAARAVNQKGKMKKEALGILVNELAYVWKSVHHRFPGRSYGNVICGIVGTEEETGPFHRFVKAVLDKAEPSLKFPNGLIRKVMDGRKLADGKLSGPPRALRSHACNR